MQNNIIFEFLLYYALCHSWVKLHLQIIWDCYLDYQIRWVVTDDSCFVLKPNKQ